MPFHVKGDKFKKKRNCFLSHLFSLFDSHVLRSSTHYCLLITLNLNMQLLYESEPGKNHGQDEDDQYFL